MKYTPKEGPYGLIRIGDFYLNGSGIYDLEGKKISTTKAKEILRLKEETLKSLQFSADKIFGFLHMCAGCGRPEAECSANPCPAVIADREDA